MKITDEEIAQEFNGNLKELGKILNSWELMPDASKGDFYQLNHQILSHLYKGVDLEKIMRVLDSELITTYGLSVDSEQSEQIALDIIDWWTGKNRFSD